MVRLLQIQFVPLEVCLDHHRYEYSIYLLLIASEIIFWIVKLLEECCFSNKQQEVLVVLCFFQQIIELSSIKENTYSMHISHN